MCAFFQNALMQAQATKSESVQEFSDKIRSQVRNNQGLGEITQFTYTSVCIASIHLYIDGGDSTQSHETEGQQ